MHTKTSILGLAAFIGGLFPPPPASAQLLYAPEPSAPLTAKDISTRPPVLGMEAIVYALGGPLQFEVRNGALVLTQTPEGIVIGKPENRVLWTGSSGTEPQKFALVTTASEERIEDGSGKPIWSQPIQPKLTLDFDQPGFVRLLDADGKQLGSDPVDTHIPQRSWSLNGHPFSRGYATTDHGVRVEADVFDQQMAVYDGKYLLWSGPRPPNNGIRLGSSPGSRVIGIATSHYAAGSVIPFMVTKEVGSMDIADKNHRPLETVPTEALHLTALNNDPDFRKDIRNFWFLHAPVATTQVDLSTPGFLSVQYRAASGDITEQETLHAVQGTQPRSSDHQPEDFLETIVTSFDSTGKRIGGVMTRSNKYGVTQMSSS